MDDAMALFHITFFFSCGLMVGWESWAGPWPEMGLMLVFHIARAIVQFTFRCWPMLCGLVIRVMIEGEWLMVARCVELSLTCSNSTAFGRETFSMKCSCFAFVVRVLELS
jgi:hypothetical protein